MKRDQSLGSLTVDQSSSWLFGTRSPSSIDLVCSYILLIVLYLQRSDIGNARIAGLSESLHLSSRQYEWLLRAFYITYILFEWMTLFGKCFPHIGTVRMAILMPLLDPIGWLQLTVRTVSICVASWGLIALMRSMAFSFTSLLVLRGALGIGEAAFVGVPYFMSFFYKPDELAFRTGLVYFRVMFPLLGTRT